MAYQDRGRADGALYIRDKGPGGESTENLVRRVLRREIPRNSKTVRLELDLIAKFWNNEKYQVLNLEPYQGKTLYFIPTGSLYGALLFEDDGTGYIASSVNTDSGLARCVVRVRPNDPVGEWLVPIATKDNLIVLSEDTNVTVFIGVSE